SAAAAPASLSSTAAPEPAAAPVAAPAAPPRRCIVERVCAANAPALDRLFHLMVAAKASDLHLSSGMPPLVRKDGKIRPLEPSAAALSHDEMGRVLEPIMPEVNRNEFAKRNDTDFAYEIKGLARFR